MLHVDSSQQSQATESQDQSAHSTPHVYNLGSSSAHAHEETPQSCNIDVQYHRCTRIDPGEK